MPLIWNNKEYKLVNDDSEWDKLEFVIARKLRVVYNEPITIDRVKKSFAIYGDIEKIETFRDDSSKTQFAHVTFKDSRMTYLALIDIKENPHHDMNQIQPAEGHQQPDNPVDLSMSPFYNLPDKCLLAVFGYCDITSLATLSVVCKKMFHLLRDRLFSNNLKFKTITLNKMNVVNALVTVGRLVQCIDPKTFHIKIRRSFDCLHWPSVAVDFVGSDNNKLSVDVSFYKREWLCSLEPIAQLINSICIQRTVYDKNLPYNGNGKIMLWPNANLLIMRGFSTKKSVPDFTSIVTAMPNLETIRIQRLLFKMNLRNLHTKNLKKIYFESCSFKSDISKDRIVQLANHVKAKGAHFPLCLIFDRIQTIRHQHVIYPIQFDGDDDEPDDDDDDSENNDDYKHQFKDPEYITIVQESTYSEIIKALHDETVSEFLYIEIGKVYRDEQ